METISKKQIILRSLTFNFKEINAQFPTKKGLKKKIFFQAELQGVENGNAIFGIIAYPAWKSFMYEKWEIGSRVCASSRGEENVLDFNEALGIGNNELLMTPYKKNRPKKKKDRKKVKRFLKLFRTICADEKLMEKAFFNCKTRISENPHLEYDVTLRSGESSETLRANPCPPSPPQEQ